MWNESFMPAVRDASRPTHTQEAASFPGSLRFRRLGAPCAYTSNNKEEKCAGSLNLCSTNLLGWRPCLKEYSLRCLCHSALLRLALGGQPFSISNDVPQKSVSRATGVPNTRGSFARRVFYLHFPVSLRGCRLIQTSRGGECERVVEGKNTSR